jgi:hypothetical protein
MGASRPLEEGSSTGGDVRPELVAFIRIRMSEMRLSIRMLEAATPHLRRSRLHSIVHPDPTKRRPMRVDEAHAICNALGITQWEAAFGSELLEGGLTESIEEASSLAAFMATVFTGLAPRLANTVAAISGLDLSDVRPEHGAQIQNILLAEFERGYSDLVRRKGLRLLGKEDC